MFAMTWRVVFNDDGICKETLITVVEDTVVAVTSKYLEILRDMNTLILISEPVQIGNNEDATVQN